MAYQVIIYVKVHAYTVENIVLKAKEMTWFTRQFNPDLLNKSLVSQSDLFDQTVIIFATEKSQLACYIIILPWIVI